MAFLRPGWNTGANSRGIHSMHMARRVVNLLIKAIRWWAVFLFWCWRKVNVRIISFLVWSYRDLKRCPHRCVPSCTTFGGRPTAVEWQNKGLAQTGTCSKPVQPAAYCFPNVYLVTCTYIRSERWVNFCGRLFFVVDNRPAYLLHLSILCRA